MRREIVRIGDDDGESMLIDQNGIAVKVEMCGEDVSDQIVHMVVDDLTGQRFVTKLRKQDNK